MYTYMTGWREIHYGGDHQDDEKNKCLLSIVPEQNFDGKVYAISKQNFLNERSIEERWRIQTIYGFKKMKYWQNYKGKPAPWFKKVFKEAGRPVWL